MKVFFYCDESGAKGYANQDEAFAGEIGVFAGIMVPEECLATVKQAFDQIASRYTPASGKLHIAELPREQQETIFILKCVSIVRQIGKFFLKLNHHVGLQAGRFVNGKEVNPPIR